MESPRISFGSECSLAGGGDKAYSNFMSFIFVAPDFDFFFHDSVYSTPRYSGGGGPQQSFRAVGHGISACFVAPVSIGWTALKNRSLSACWELLRSKKLGRFIMRSPTHRSKPTNATLTFDKLNGPSHNASSRDAIGTTVQLIGPLRSQSGLYMRSYSRPYRMRHNSYGGKILRPRTRHSPTSHL